MWHKFAPFVILGMTFDDPRWRHCQTNRKFLRKETMVACSEHAYWLSKKLSDLKIIRKETMGYHPQPIHQVSWKYLKRLLRTTRHKKVDGQRTTTAHPISTAPLTYGHSGAKNMTTGWPYWIQLQNCWTANDGGTKIICIASFEMGRQQTMG